jgi:hypothetical protein
VKSRLVLVAAALGSGGCVAPAPPSPAGQLVQTEQQVYRATVDQSAVRLTVIATLTNRTPDTLTLHPCAQHPPYPLAVRLDRWEERKWRSVMGPICTLALMKNPPRLAPGRSRTDTVRLWGSRQPNVIPTFPPGPVAGTYRLVYSSVYRTWHPDAIGTDPNDRIGRALPESLLVSNGFRVIE